LVARVRTMVNSCSWAPTLAMTLILFTNDSLATITNFKEVDGFNYATLGNAEVNSADLTGCESDKDYEVPKGWELVPWSDHEKVRDDVVSESSFNTDGVVLADGGVVRGKSTGRNPAEVHEKAGELWASGPNRDRYSVDTCALRVLIRQKVTTTTTQTISTTTQSISTTATTTQTTSATATTAKLRKRVAMASKSLHAVLGWSTVLAPVMFWAWAP